MKIIDLLEAPLPDDWDKSKFRRNETSFKDMVAYARERAKLAGRGSSRVAVVIPYEGRETVLKVAMNRKGILQNREEAKILGDAAYSILIPMIDYDTENGDDITWIHTEKAEKATKAKLDRSFGASFSDVVMFIGLNSIANKRNRYFSMPDLPDEVFDNELYGELESFIADYQIEGYQDFTRAANWGFYKGEPVIIDVGFHGDAVTAYLGENATLEDFENPLVKRILYHPNTRLATFFQHEFKWDEKKIVKWLEQIIELADKDVLEKLNIRPQNVINIHRRLSSGLVGVSKYLSQKDAKPFIDNVGALKVEDGVPKYLFRYISRKELESILVNGKMMPSNFFGRIHASHLPDRRYKEPDSTLVAIEFDESDGWKAKVAGGGEVYATTESPIPVEQIYKVK